MSEFLFVGGALAAGLTLIPIGYKCVYQPIMQNREQQQLLQDSSAPTTYTTIQPQQEEEEDAYKDYIQGKSVLSVDNETNYSVVLETEQVKRIGTFAEKRMGKDIRRPQQQQQFQDLSDASYANHHQQQQQQPFVQQHVFQPHTVTTKPTTPTKSPVQHSSPKPAAQPILAPPVNLSSQKQDFEKFKAWHHSQTDSKSNIYDDIHTSDDNVEEQPLQELGAVSIDISHFESSLLASTTVQPNAQEHYDPDEIVEVVQPAIDLDKFEL